MALHYDIKKVKTLREQTPELINTLLASLFEHVQNIKALVKNKDYKTSEAIIDHIIQITDTLGIDFAYDEALLIKQWNQSQEIGRDTSELQSRENLVCRLLLEKKKFYLKQLYERKKKNNERT